MMGEIGTDYKFATTEPQKEKQMILLNRQLDLSAKLKLPINLHSRRYLPLSSPPLSFNLLIDQSRETNSGCCD